MLTARDLMTSTPVTATPMTTIRSAFDLLHELDIRHLPIVDDVGELVGMISDRDLRALTLPYFADDPDAGTLRVALDARVASLMSSNVLSVDAEAKAVEVVDLMLDHKVGAIPVVDGDGLLVGIISYIDVLRALPLEAAAE
jgi:acetoin utilization protein AcuB